MKCLFFIICPSLHSCSIMFAFIITGINVQHDFMWCLLLVTVRKTLEFLLNQTNWSTFAFLEVLSAAEETITVQRSRTRLDQVMRGKIVETNGKEWREVPHQNSSEESERNKRKKCQKAERAETKNVKWDGQISRKWDREQCQVGVKWDGVHTDAHIQHAHLPATLRFTLGVVLSPQARRVFRLCGSRVVIRLHIKWSLR